MAVRLYCADQDVQRVVRVYLARYRRTANCTFCILVTSKLAEGIIYVL